MNKGDRVRVTEVNKWDEEFFSKGMEGTVVEEPYNSSVTVMFEQDARGNKDYWYVHVGNLELV